MKQASMIAVGSLRHSDAKKPEKRLFSLAPRLG